MSSVWSALFGHAGFVLTRYSTRKIHRHHPTIWLSWEYCLEGHFGSPDWDFHATPIRITSRMFNPERARVESFADQNLDSLFRCFCLLWKFVMWSTTQSSDEYDGLVAIAQAFKVSLILSFCNTPSLLIRQSKNNLILPIRNRDFDWTQGKSRTVRLTVSKPTWKRSSEVGFFLSA
jgi:hypothetical protein